MADEMTPGEISRRFDRIERDQRALDDRITSVAGQMVPAALYEAAHQALIDRVAHAETDTKAAFDRVESTSRDRKTVLEKADADNAKAITALRRALEEDRAVRVRSRPSIVANWITASGVVIALIALIVTLVTTHGGR